MTRSAEIRAAIVATIAAIPGVGRVHDRERYAKTEKDLLAYYGGERSLLGWFVRRVARRVEHPSTMRARVVTTWQIRGYASFADGLASELAFDDLADAVADAFEADDTLGGLVESFDSDDGSAGVQLVDAGPVMFSGVLCHSVRLSLATVHSEDRGVDAEGLADFNRLDTTWGGVWPDVTDVIRPNQEES